MRTKEPDSSALAARRREEAARCHRPFRTSPSSSSALRSLWSATARLLPPRFRYLVDDLVVDVGVRNDHAATAVTELDGDRRCVLFVCDVRAREVADKHC